MALDGNNCSIKKLADAINNLQQQIEALWAAISKLKDKG